MTKNVEIRLDLEDRDAQRNLKKLSKGAKDLADDFDDTESAGKQMARAIEQSADSMIDEIDDTKRAVDRMAAALDGTDMDPTKVVGDLKRVGLTAQDIEADADDLAAALRRAGDVKTHATKQGFNDVGDAVGSVEDRTGRAHGAMSSMVGGSVGELPLISESLGPIGESLGQIAEGAFEGEVGLKDMAKVGGGIALLGGAVIVVQKAMASIAETKAFNEEQVESYTEAVDELGEGIGAVNAMLDETRAIEGRTGGFAGMFESTTDIVPVLARMGVTQSEVNRAIAEGGPALAELTDRIQSYRDAQDDAITAANNRGATDVEAIANFRASGEALEVLNQQHANYSESVEEAARNAGFFRESQDEVNAAVDDFLVKQDPIAAFPAEFERMADAMANGVAPAADDVNRVTEGLNISVDDAIGLAADHADALAEQADGADDLTGSVDETTRSLEELRLEQLAAVDPVFAAMEATADYEAAIKDLNATGGDTPENQRKAVTAFGEMEAALLRVATESKLTYGEMVELGMQAGLTEAQARSLAGGLNDTTAAAEDFAGEYVADLEADPTQANADLAEVKRSAEDLDGKLVNIRVRVNQEGTITLPNGQQLRDRGGRLPDGQSAVVAERRPEFVDGQLVTTPTVVTGPANITSGQATASQLRRAALPPPVGAPVSPTVINNSTTIIAPGIRTAREADDLIRRQKRRTGR